MADNIQVQCSLLTGVYKDNRLSRLFCYLLCKSDNNWSVTTSLRQIAKATKMTLSEVRTSISRMCDLGILTQQSERRSTRLTLQCMSENKATQRTAEPKRKKANAVAVANIVGNEFVDSAFENVWQDWIEYRKAHNRPYKNNREAKKGYEHLLKLANNDPKQAADIVNQTIANGWQGLFPNKTNETKQTYTTSTDNATARHKSRERLYTLASGVVSQSSDKLYNLYYGGGINSEHSEDKE